MSVSCLPKSITKDVLFKRAQERFKDWVRMYDDPNVSATYMYEDMSASCYCGAAKDDFPEAFKTVYQYDDEGSSCFFMVDGVRFDVYDLRSMRPCPRVNKETYADVCVLNCDFIEDGAMLFHIIPATWLYGSTTSEFDEGKPVHDEFLQAAKEYIQRHHITPEMQKLEY